MRPFKFTRYFIPEQGDFYRVWKKNGLVLAEIMKELDQYGIGSFVFTQQGLKAVFPVYMGEPELDPDVFYKRFTTTTFLGTECYLIKFRLPNADSPLLRFFELCKEHYGVFSRLHSLAYQLGNDFTKFDVQYLYLNDEVVPVLAAQDHFIEGEPVFISNTGAHKLKEVPGYVISDIFQERNPELSILDQIHNGLLRADFSNDWVVYQMLTNMMEDYANNYPTWTKQQLVEHNNKFSTLMTIAKKAGLPVGRLHQ